MTTPIELATRLSEYRNNPHHIDPMSERFNRLLDDINDYLRRDAQTAPAVVVGWVKRRKHDKFIRVGRNDAPTQDEIQMAYLDFDEWLPVYSTPTQAEARVGVAAAEPFRCLPFVSVVQSGCGAAHLTRGSHQRMDESAYRLRPSQGRGSTMKQLFNHPQSDRAQTTVSVSFAELYKIVRNKLDYFHPDKSDPDAFCQDMCVQIEKKMGIFPNIPAALKTEGEAR